MTEPREVTAQDMIETGANPRSSPRHAAAPVADQLTIRDGDAPAVLLPYQQELLGCDAQVVVYEKSRRIGISWAAACQAVLISSASEAAGGDDSFYIGFEKEMTRGFIDDCAFWAKHFAVAADDVEEFLFDDSDKDGEKSIQAFRVRFASGKVITALTSKPRNLRSRQGFVILDEAAFMDDLVEMMKAAFALLIWGSRIWIISSQKDVDNAFNELVEDCRAKKVPYKLFRTTFDDAIEQGLYRRICLKKGVEWTAEGEKAWAAEIRAFYGAGAARELDCVPDQGSGVFLSRNLIELCAVNPSDVYRLTCPPGFDLKPKAERRSFLDGWLEDNIAPAVKRLDKNLRHAFGQDFARSGDVSAFVPIVVTRTLTRSVPFVIEMRNVPYDQQKQLLFWVVDQLPRFFAGKLDSNGNGDYLGESAQQQFGATRIEKVKPSQPWYLENMAPMKAAFEARELLIPRDDDLIDDLRQIKLDKGVPMVAAGVHTKGTDGQSRHGDFAVALCLAYAASRQDAPEIDYRPVARATALDGGQRRDDDDDFSRRHGGAFARHDAGRAGFNRSKGCF